MRPISFFRHSYVKEWLTHKKRCNIIGFVYVPTTTCITHVFLAVCVVYCLSCMLQCCYMVVCYERLSVKCHGDLSYQALLSCTLAKIYVIVRCIQVILMCIGSFPSYKSWLFQTFLDVGVWPVYMSDQTFHIWSKWKRGRYPCLIFYSWPEKKYAATNAYSTNFKIFTVKWKEKETKREKWRKKYVRH